MTAAERHRTLPVRAWFALAGIMVVFLVVILVLGVLTLAGRFADQPEDRAADAAAGLEAAADRWHDPEWRDAQADDLASDEVDFRLLEDGRELYRSEGTTGTPEPGSPEDPPWDDEHDNAIVRRVEVAGTNPRLSAYVYVPRDADGVRGSILLVTAALGVAAAAVAWLLAWAFIRPLRATRRAAHQVATGDLDIALPRSRVTEVDAVITTFDTMADELRGSLERQAALEQERRLFVAAVAHDLRTPLFSLRGYLEGLEIGVADTPEKRARYLDGAAQKAHTLEQLVDDLFEYTRLDYVDQAPERQTFDLADLLRQLTDGSQPEAETGGLAVRFRPATDPCPVEADRHQLTRAVTNLLDNALRHTPSGGRIEVSCGGVEASGDTDNLDDDGPHEGATAWLTVSDTGPGIAPSDLPHLFQPLYRGDAARSSGSAGGSGAAGGSGLGLAVAHRIFTAHGGDLRAENRPEGGARFTGTIGSTDSQP